jgi:hypothetical protein
MPMRTIWGSMRWLCLFLALAGCRSSTPDIKPAPTPEALVLPPSDDPRYSLPIKYPQEVLNGNDMKKAVPAMPTPGGPMPGPGRMGPGGMGGFQ